MIHFWDPLKNELFLLNFQNTSGAIGSQNGAILSGNREVYHCVGVFLKVSNSEILQNISKKWLQNDSLLGPPQKRAVPS